MNNYDHMIIELNKYLSCFGECHFINCIETKHFDEVNNFNFEESFESEGSKDNDLWLIFTVNGSQFILTKESGEYEVLGLYITSLKYKIRDDKGSILSDDPFCENVTLVGNKKQGERYEC